MFFFFPVVKEFSLYIVSNLDVSKKICLLLLVTKTIYKNLRVFKRDKKSKKKKTSLIKKIIFLFRYFLRFKKESHGRFLTIWYLL